MGKKIWLSKTFWANIIGAAILAYNAITGKAEDPAKYTVVFLPYINVLLRIVTKEKIEW